MKTSNIYASMLTAIRFKNSIWVKINQSSKELNNSNGNKLLLQS
jgi:hypothetical protein